MRIIKPSFEIWDQEEGLEGIYKQIEKAGRVCYKSEDKITDTSAKDFVDRMIKSGHGAMLEHGTVYLKAEFEVEFYGGEEVATNPLINYVNNKYSKVTKGKDTLYVTTNLRVLVENDLLSDLRYICGPTEFHEKRITVKFTCDRGVSHEFVRHRVFSFAQESTRYCNYSKDKFGNEITFIQPCWDYIKTAAYNGVDNFDGDYFEHSLREAESYYFKLLDQGWKPQQARAVLPNSLKTELVMTGFTKDWEHFFGLRDAGSAHPQARELAQPLHEEFIKRNHIV